MTIHLKSGPERRAEITAGIQAETGIDEAMIERLVRGFYRRVRSDALIGPVFEARRRSTHFPPEPEPPSH